MMLSVSALSLYLYCPRKLFLEKILKLKEPPKESLVLGSLRHNIYDEINKMDQKLVESFSSILQYKDILATYKEAYLKSTRNKIINFAKDLRDVGLEPSSVFVSLWPHIQGEMNERSFITHSFMTKHSVFGRDLWKKITPKFLSEVSVESSALGLRGIVDRVAVYGDGYVPVELKTGSAPKEGTWPGHRIQIAAYALLLEEHFQTSVKEGYVHYLDIREQRHLSINPFIREEIKKLVSEINIFLERKILPKFAEERKCVNCGLREQCHSQTEMQELLSNII